MAIGGVNNNGGNTDTSALTGASVSSTGASCPKQSR